MLYPPLVRKVIVSQTDSVIFYGVSETGGAKSHTPTLSYEENDIRLDYSVPEFNAPEKTRFQHRLLGRDIQWSEWTLKTSVDFNNLRDIDVRIALEEDRSLTLTGSVNFGRLPERTLQGRSQERIAMKAEFHPVHESFDHLFYTDTITLDFGLFRQKRLYFLEQDADFVPLIESGPVKPAVLVGMNNKQLWNRFHVAIGGQIAPRGAVIVPGITGLVGP